MPTSTTKSITLTDLLSHLIRMPTVTSDHATNRAAMDWVQEQLQGLPLQFKRFENNGFPSLVATTPTVADHKNPRLWLVGHMDVVPGANSDFSPKLQGGKLVGRGAFDMKFAIACFIRLLQELGPDLARYNLGLMITSDEEAGGQHGVRWLVDQGYLGQAALLPDGGFNWEMELGAKGIIWWGLDAVGQSTHASTAWRGANALDRLIAFVNVIQSHAIKEPCGDLVHAHHTINLGKLTGGSVPNQVPNHATAEIDFRITPSQSVETVNGWLAEAAAAVPGVTARVILSNPAYTIPQDGPVTLFRQLAGELTGRTLPNVISNGASDARFFAAHHIPVVSVRPTGGNQHGPGEWIDLEDLTQYYDVVRRFVEEWAGPASS